MKRQSTALTVARWLGAALFALLTAFSIPTIAVSTWMKTTILNTDAVVEALAPLSQNNQFQNFLAISAADQASALVEENLPLGTLDTLASGLGSLLDSLPFGLHTGSVLDNPSAALTEEISGLVQQQTLAFVQGPAFPPVWNATVRETHGQFVSLMEEGTPSGGTGATSAVLDISLGPIIEALRQSLTDEGEWWAAYIPTVTSTVPVVEIEDLPRIQQYYNAVQGSERWLTWAAVSFGLLALLLAPKRLLVLGAGALATFLVSAVLWRNIPGFGEENFSVLIEGDGAAVSAQVWSYLSDPLTVSMQAVAGASVIVAILALIAALITYVVGGRRKKLQGPES